MAAHNSQSDGHSETQPWYRKIFSAAGALLSRLSGLLENKDDSRAEHFSTSEASSQPRSAPTYSTVKKSKLVTKRAPENYDIYSEDPLFQHSSSKILKRTSLSSSRRKYMEQQSQPSCTPLISCGSDADNKANNHTKFTASGHTFLPEVKGNDSSVKIDHTDLLISNFKLVIPFEEEIIHDSAKSNIIRTEAVTGCGNFNNADQEQLKLNSCEEKIRFEDSSLERQNQVDNLCEMSRETENLCEMPRETDTLCEMSRETESLCEISRETGNLCEMSRETDNLCEMSRETDSLLPQKSLADQISKKTIQFRGKAVKVNMVSVHEKLKLNDSDITSTKTANNNGNFNKADKEHSELDSCEDKIKFGDSSKEIQNQINNSCEMLTETDSCDVLQQKSLTGQTSKKAVHFRGKTIKVNFLVKPDLPKQKQDVLGTNSQKDIPNADSNSAMEGISASS